MCKDQLWQARLEKNVFNLGSVNKAVTVSVGPCKHLVILNFLGCRHNPLATRHLTSKQQAIIINHTKPFSRKKNKPLTASPLFICSAMCSQIKHFEPTAHFNTQNVRLCTSIYSHAKDSNLKQLSDLNTREKLHHTNYRCL